MKITHARHLSNVALVNEVARLARSERAATVAFIVHLAEFDARRLYAEAGFSSTFSYCLEALHLSEDAAFNRIEAARAMRAHPQMIEMLVSGALSPTTARMLRRHLTPENDEAVLAAASGKSKAEVEKLLAGLFPRPDVPSSIRPVPATSTASATSSVGSAPPDQPSAAPVAPPRSAAPLIASPARPVVRPLAAERYEIRFTARAETRERLRQAQDLLADVVPTGDLGEIFDRALALLVSDLQRKKAAMVKTPRATARPCARGDSRCVPAAVRREVWKRDGGRCAFVAASGRRCGERRHLQYHHGPVPYGDGGEATLENIQLFCRSHNRYEAEQVYGPRRAYAGVAEAVTRSGTGGQDALAGRDRPSP